jgi:hypothetical protein
MGWQFRRQAVWNVRLKPKLQTNTTNASLKAVHQRNTQSRQLAKVELVLPFLNSRCRSSHIPNRLTDYPNPDKAESWSGILHPVGCQIAGFPDPALTAPTLC